MGYADATADFPVFGLPTPALESVTTSLIQAHLDAASDFADGCIAARIPLPIEGPPYPKRLVQAVCQIASFTILRTVGFNPDIQVNKEVLAAHDQAKEWLEQIREGRITPTFPVNPAAEATSLPSRGWYDSTGRIA